MFFPHRNAWPLLTFSKDWNRCCPNVAATASRSARKTNVAASLSSIIMAVRTVPHFRQSSSHCMWRSWSTQLGVTGCCCLCKRTVLSILRYHHQYTHCPFLFILLIAETHFKWSKTVRQGKAGNNSVNRLNQLIVPGMFWYSGVWAKKTLYIIHNSYMCKPRVQQYSTNVDLLHLASLELLCTTGCVPHHFQYKEVAFLLFPQNLSIKFLIIQWSMANARKRYTA